MESSSSSSTPSSPSSCRPVSFTRDTCLTDSDTKHEHYSLTCFIVSEAGRRWSVLPAAERKRTVLDQIREVFGAEVGGVDHVPMPVDIVEREWEDGITPVLPPEVLDGEAGRTLGEPFGHVHFVGSETADKWRGYMEGALRSGIRGAREVIASLKQ